MIRPAFCKRNRVVDMPSASRSALAIVLEREQSVADVALAARSIEDRLQLVVGKASSVRHCEL